MNKQKRPWKRPVNHGTMKQTAIILTVLGTFITGTPCVRAESDNPFGFETNKHPLEYEYCQKDKALSPTALRSRSLRGHGYTCSSAPRPHPDFPEYTLSFVEGVGLCFISATGYHYPLFPWQGLGMFKEQIAQKYGQPTSKAESKRAYHWYHWWPKEGFDGLGDVQMIELYEYEPKKYRMSAAVSFWLVPFNTCLKKIDEKADHAF